MTVRDTSRLPSHKSFQAPYSFSIQYRALLAILALFFGANMAMNPLKSPTYKHYVVVGGGVCGVTCCQTIAQEENCRVTLVAAKGLLKGVANVVKLTRNIDSFEIVDQVILRELSNVLYPHNSVTLTVNGVGRP
jgi:hypothetical protein